MRCESCQFDLQEGSRFCSQCGMPTAQLVVERRPLTVLVYDLVDYTKLASALDPEDVQRTIRRLNDCATRVIRKHGGVIARYAGDGSLAYFGVPHARGDDARFAIEAGLELTDAVQALEVAPGQPLHTRVGIATGEVVVGDVLSHGPARELTAHGEALPLAARLQALAEPDTVVVCQATRNGAAGYFELESLGRHALKGFAQPVPAWRVVSPREVEGRFAARVAPGAPLAGRDEEIARLEACLDATREGRGRIVFVSGEAGIGKSRVVADFRARHEGDATAVAYFQCSADHQATAFHPVVSQLRAALARVEVEPGAPVAARVRRLLAASSRQLDRDAAVVAGMLDLDDGAGGATAAAPEAQMKADFTRIVLGHLDALAQDGVALAIFEDAHWIDPSTADLLRQLCARAPERRLLVLVTSRWTDGLLEALGDEVHPIHLDRLADAQAMDIVDAMTGAQPLAEATVESIVARAAGVPLFVEELTRAAIELGDGVVAADTKPDEMPLLVRDALVVRLDRLGPARRVARTASALGRDFTRGLLESVSAVIGEQLTTSLGELERAGVLQRVDGAGEATYAFRHDLLRNAAYDLMLRDERTDLHARIAAAIETQFAHLARQQPELIARHYGEAGQYDRSIDAWIRGGARAAARSSFAEAISAYSTALGLLAHLPEGRARDELQLRLELGLGEAHAGAGGFASAPAGDAYNHALARAEALGAEDALLRAYPGLFSFHHMGGRLAKAREIAERFHLAAERHGDLVDRIAAHRVLGCMTFSVAEYETAYLYLTRALELYDEAPPAELARATINAQDQKTTALAYYPIVLALSGDPGRAWDASQAGIAHSEQLGHIHSIGYSLTFATGLAAMLMGRERDLAELSDRAMAYARDEQFPNWRMARVFHALSLAESGAVEEGLAEMRAGFASYGQMGGLIFAPLGMRHLARALELTGQLEEAVATLDRGLAVSAQTGEIWTDPLLLAHQGDVLAKLNEPARAVAAYERALAGARATGAALFELRAAAGLARVQLRRARRDEAREVLTTSCARFGEGMAFPELDDARALLREVA